MELALKDGSLLIVDDEDAHYLTEWRWHPHRVGPNVYARGCRKGTSGRQQYLHRLIVGARPTFDVDHVNNNGLDNRRANLREATRSQNNANRHRVQSKSSQHKGVHFEQQTRRWRAEIVKDGVRYRLGRFASQDVAAAAYDAKARELYPDFGHGALRSD